MDGYRRHVQAVIPPSRTAELQVVDEIARRLVGHLERAREDVAALQLGQTTGATVEDHVALLLQEELGFGEEAAQAPQSGVATEARPALVYRLAPDRAVIAAVERGGTTTPHDLEDVWESSLPPDAHHLFLIVPRDHVGGDGSARADPFAIVARRLGAFFGDRREIDLLSAHVFAC